MSNLLIQAYRKPSLYVTLPSGGKYYDIKPKLSVDGDLAVYAMTARDELITKTPDALFNGEATSAIIRSCCPDIANPDTVPVNDLLVILLAIRQATYGKDLNVDVKCPSCSELNMLAVDANRVLASAKQIKIDDCIVLKNEFKIGLKPYNLKDRTLLQIQQIKQKKMIESLISTEIDEDQRGDIFGRTFVELAELTIKLVANSITSVTLAESGEIVTDAETIDEWLQTITKVDYEMIKDLVEQLSKPAIDTNFKATCQTCGHNWSTDVDLDIANFFVG
jgi:hypothetical protein